MPKTALRVAKKPCRECPFREKSWPGYLGGGLWNAAKDYLKLARSDKNVPCHMSPGFNTEDPMRSRPCAGLAIFRHHTHKIPKNRQAADAVLRVDVNAEGVLTSAEQFLAHHTSSGINTSNEDIVKSQMPKADCFLVKNEGHPDFGKYMVVATQSSGIPLGTGETREQAFEKVKNLFQDIDLTR